MDNLEQTKIKLKIAISALKDIEKWNDYLEDERASSSNNFLIFLFFYSNLIIHISYWFAYFD